MTFDKSKTYVECYFTFFKHLSSFDAHTYIIRIIRKRSRDLIRRILSSTNVGLQYIVIIQTQNIALTITICTSIRS